MWYTRSGLQLGIARYTFAGQYVKDKKVLEIACENGYGASYLLSKGAQEVTGGDISEQAIQYAKEHYKADGLNFLRLDAQQLLFADESFDVIVAFEVIEHLEDYNKFLIECKRVLKRDGIFICSTPNRLVESGNRNRPWFPGHTKEFLIEEFHNLIAAHFDNIAIYGICAGAKPPGLMNRIIYGPKPSMLKPFMPIGVKLMNFFTAFTFRSNHLISLEKIDEKKLDKLVEPKYQPFLIQDDTLSPLDIMIVSRKNTDKIR